MCGIAGVVWTDPEKAIDPSALARMTDALAHRGPDGEGSFRSEFALRPGYGPTPGVALGCRRLAIIDADGGRQPLANEDGSVVVVFNGEIYNYRDLRRRLEGAGHRFKSASDTETIVHLYQDEGLDFVRHLDGMFALALWDATRRRLVLARDRLGKKPLVYRREPGRLLFASEAKSLLVALPDSPREIDPQSLDEYLTYGYVPHLHSIWRGMNKLLPAHLAVYEDDRLTFQRYWQPDFNREVSLQPDVYVQSLRERFTAAVQARLQSDVPLGAFLSGGVDSTLTVGIMQQLSDRPVKTFSLGFEQSEFDETPFAREVAARLGTEHYEFRLEPRPAETLPRLAWHFDEPFGDSSAWPTYELAKRAREHVTVALTGDGGDELFLGYRRYRAASWAARIDRLPAGLRRALAGRRWDRIGPARGRQSRLRQLARFLAPLALPPARRYLAWTCMFQEAQRAELYNDALIAQLPDADPVDFLVQAFQQVAQREPATQASLVDMTTYLPCDLLVKVDLASMAHGLECRQPFLDHRLVELAAQMPCELKLHSGRGKWILRQAFPELVSESTLRRRKQGFAVPLDRWFRGELRELARNALSAADSMATRCFRPQAVERLLAEHESGQVNHGDRLWSLLMLELWAREWLAR